MILGEKKLSGSDIKKERCKCLANPPFRNKFGDPFVPKDFVLCLVIRNQSRKAVLVDKYGPFAAVSVGISKSAELRHPRW